MFDRYHVGMGLDKKSTTEEVSILLYTMDNIADDLLATQKINENVEKKQRIMQQHICLTLITK